VGGFLIDTDVISEFVGPIRVCGLKGSSRITWPFKLPMHSDGAGFP
jgi:hypothetical protein